MMFVKVKWHHDFEDEPVEIFSEVDNKGWVLRCLELFPDKSWGYSDGVVSALGTQLAKEPLPTLSEIAQDPQFVPEKITKEEFEELWKNVLEKSGCYDDWLSRRNSKTES